jgi:hypothetical protein
MNTDLPIISRPDVLALAARLDWPRCTYAGITLEGRAAWETAGMVYACDRRELIDQLRAIEARK